MIKFARIIAPALVATLGMGALATPAMAQWGQPSPYGNRTDATRYTPVRDFNVRRDIGQLDRIQYALRAERRDRDGRRG